jgi:hypothetical protein
MASLIAGTPIATQAEAEAGTRNDVAMTPLSTMQSIAVNASGGASLPSQAGNAGKVLTTNGTVASWGNTPAELPSQSGNAGKYLKTDGSAVSWDTPAGGSGKLVGFAYTQNGAVATGTAQIPRDDTIPQSSEGTQFMSLAYTPANASNILVIEVLAVVAHSGFNSGTLALFKDSDANALAAVPYDFPGANYITPFPLTHCMVAGTTSQITFKVRAGSDGSGTTTFNGVGGNRKFGGVIPSSIRITEYLP